MNIERILGVRFFNGTCDEAVSLASRGGLVLCPSGPGLAGDLLTQPAYRESLQEADLVLPDSGLMVLCHRFLTGSSMPRLSGLTFLRQILEGPLKRDRESSFWVMPTPEERDRTLSFLARQGIVVSQEDTYLAPRYGAGPLHDRELVGILKARHPKWIILGIGGGVQERLGYSLRRTLDATPAPAILCIGAAIAFLTGGQANIPPWADRLYLGWLLRCLHRPGAFIPRYWNARHLPWLMWKYRDRLPPLREEAGG